MKDFRLYELEDFVMDEDFIRWVHVKGHADEVFWDNWLAQNPSKLLLVAEARQIVEYMRLEQRKVPVDEMQSEIAKVLKVIGDDGSQNGPLSYEPRIRRKRWRVAAIIILLAITGVLLIPSSKEKKIPASVYTAIASSPSFTERVNSTDKMTSLVLPDGSSVQLSAGSRVSYANHFDSGNTRDVYLSGEASFTVANNPRHAFRVIANEIVTKVLGTSFSVRCFEKDTTIRVSVKTGKVSVAGIILASNQQLVYQRSGQKFQKTLVESPSFITADTLDRSMSYEDKPVAAVFEQLARCYGINIVFDNELLRKCTVTADLTNESFYHKLDLICNAIGAKYEVLDGQVVIQSYGCQ